MEGVTVLGQINGVSSHDELGILIGSGIVIAFFLYNGVRMFMEGKFGLGLFAVLVSFLFMSIAYNAPVLKNPVVYSQVSVEDNVSFNDFMEKYSVFSCNKDGTYTVVERKP